MLPPALIDYTFSRLAGPVSFGAGRVRYLATAALALKSPEFPDPATTYALSRSRLNTGALKVRSSTRPTNAVSSELARRVRELEKLTDKTDVELEPPFFSEQDLLTFYEDILAHPDAQEEVSKVNTDLEALHRQDLKLVESIDLRLRTNEYRPTKLTTTLRGQVGESSQNAIIPVHLRVLNQIQQILTGIESTALPIALLSMEEWRALLRTTLSVRDTESAETLIDLIKRSNVEVPEDFVNDILAIYAKDGNCVGFEASLAKLIQNSPTEQQRHLHVKAHLKSVSLESIPSSALSVLHNYELQSLPPPMKTYSLVIHRLFSIRDTVSQAQGWDIFSHMRYVAHPTPDALLYTQMIRACASSFTSRSSDPERALDLWTEMTVDHRISPTSGTWNAVILACARSGRKVYVNEAFRLAKEMLDSHRDAYGRLAYTPDNKTFCALLEGAKRIGDLARARWILAEMVKSSEEGVYVDEEVMMHVFHAYASYQPPFKRSLAPMVEDQSASASDSQSDDMATTSEPFPAQDLSIAPQQANAFTHIPPQSHSEVVAEVELLFSRTLHETGHRLDSTNDENSLFPNSSKFSRVQLTTRLVNSYLSTHYKHNSLQAARDVFWNVFEANGVERDSRTYMEALERCAISKKADRDVALRFAEELFAKWQELEEKGGKEISPRTQERVNAAYIRILTLTGNLDRAVTHLRSFVKRFPASAIRDPNSIVKPPMRATRTRLVGTRPLVRLTTQTEIPDQHVPPLLTWKDLEVLHHRLVIVGNREKDIAYIKYVTKSYEWALRVRRDATMRAVPETETGAGTGEVVEVRKD